MLPTIVKYQNSVGTVDQVPIERQVSYCAGVVTSGPKAAAILSPSPVNGSPLRSTVAITTIEYCVPCITTQVGGPRTPAVNVNRSPGLPIVMSFWNIIVSLQSYSILVSSSYSLKFITSVPELSLLTILKYQNPPPGAEG